MPPKLKFVEGEKVLCFHGPLIYEAKALRHQVTKDKQVKYFIHYAGWNKNWDEWVPENRVLKYNEANVQRQKEVSKLHASGSAKNKKGAVAATAAATVKPKKTDSTSSSGKDVDSRASTPSKELKDAAAAAGIATPSDTPTPSSASTTPVPSGAAASNTASNTPAVTSSSTPPPTTSSGSSAGTDSGAAAAAAAILATGASTPVIPAATTTTNAPSVSARSGRVSKPSSTTTSTTSTTTTPAVAAGNETKDEATKKKRARLDTSSNSTTSASSSSSAAAAAVIAAGTAAAVALAASAESEEQFNAKMEIKIKIPDDLKPWLVDDWDAINQQQKLLELPAKQSVRDIVNAYIAYKKGSKQPANKEVAMTDIATGLLSYFDVMLGCQLLYKFERPQYTELLEQHPDKPMSALYGAFHLLRLFTRLGSILAFTTLDEKAVQLLLFHLQDFLKYLVKNASTLFSIQHFVNVTSEYHRKV